MIARTYTYNVMTCHCIDKLLALALHDIVALLLALTTLVNR